MDRRPYDPSPEIHQDCDWSAMKDEELKKQIVAKVKNKKSAKMLPETRTLMPQVTGVSMPVQTYEGAELIEILNKKQERTILGMFAWAKNLARTESGKSNEFLETMEQLGLPKTQLDEVRKLFGGSASKGSDEGGEGKMERRYANAMIVTSDLLHRAVAAQRTGAALEDE